MKGTKISRSVVRNIHVHVYVLYTPLHDIAPHIQTLPCFSLFDTEHGKAWVLGYL